MSKVTNGRCPSTHPFYEGEWVPAHVADELLEALERLVRLDQGSAPSEEFQQAREAIAQAQKEGT